MWGSAFMFLATLGFVAVTIGLSVLFLLQKRPKLARLSVSAAGIAIGIYAIALLAVGMRSEGTKLGAGQEKHICELDCHLAYSVLAAQRTAPTEYQVTLRMRFDPETIGANRGNSPLTAGGRIIALIDSEGHEYTPSQTNGLDSSLHPGEAAEAHLTFQIPANATPQSLRFEDNDPIKKLLIGSETAPMHKRTFFALS